MKKKPNYRFLTESVLLEEFGLPKINNIIITSITMLIIIFIFWSNFLMMEETIQTSGNILNQSEKITVIGNVNSQDIVYMTKGTSVYVSIPGVTNKQSLEGEITAINTTPKESNNNNITYEVLIELDKEVTTVMKDSLFHGMKCRIKAVTETKSMLQFLLGNLYETGRDIF